MKSFAFSAAVGRFRLVAITAWLLLPASFLFGVEPAAARVSAGYRDAEQFYRISEFFTGRENTGGEIILRSQEDARAGFYFTVRLPRYPYRQEVSEAVRLEVIMPGDVEPTLFTFALAPERRRNPLILVGLTGDDWPNARAIPLAWRISFADANGEIFAREKSFLWGRD